MIKILYLIMICLTIYSCGRIDVYHKQKEIQTAHGLYYIHFDQINDWEKCYIVINKSSGIPDIKDSIDNLILPTSVAFYKNFRDSVQVYTSGEVKVNSILIKYPIFRIVQIPYETSQDYLYHYNKYYRDINLQFMVGFEDSLMFKDSTN